ncbi:MAG: hypothetical protein ACREX6_05055 [Casimicrobiaceae bacterium]
MQRATGIILVAIATAAILGGCAFHNARDDYMFSRSSDGLWGADYGLIDWKFPTSQNQPPAEAPERIHPERTAIGVTWATTDTYPYDWPSHFGDPEVHAPAQAGAASTAPAAANAGDHGAPSTTAAANTVAPKNVAASGTAPAAGSGKH